MESDSDTANQGVVKEVARRAVGRKSRLRGLVVLGLLLLGVLVVTRTLQQIFVSKVVASDEQVLLFPTVGHLSQDGKTWLVPVHGWIFEEEKDDPLRNSLLATTRKLVGLEKGQVSANFDRRIRRFLVDNEGGKQLTVRIANKSFVLPASTKNGQFGATVRVPSRLGKNRTMLACDLALADGDKRSFHGLVHLLPNEGLSVVSDIDDTVKISGVTDKKKLLRNTFLEDFKVVSGMAARYRRWAKERGARFHFVSASPWQLYEELASFLAKEGFPPASFHLKSIRLKDLSILRLFSDPAAGKLAAIRPLFETFPRRRFVLVGDSGEKDPEAYGELAREFGKQVLRIFIRNVTKEDARGKRFRQAFRDLPQKKWVVFRDARELVLDGE